MSADPNDIAALRARLARSGGASWRSFDEIADTEDFRRFLKAEYPSAAPLASGMDRRRFFRVMAASLAMAGLAGCGQNNESEGTNEDGRNREVPYVRNPEHLQPATTMRYNSGTLLDGYANGMRILTRNGRPLKVEGNPDHPWTRGGTDIFAQASVLGLYDPYRSQSVLYLDRVSTWESFRGAMAGPMAQFRAQGGRGLRLLTGPVTSPSLAAQIADLRRQFPQMHWHSAAPAGREAIQVGTGSVFGRPLEPRWRFDRARLVVALDGDFLDPGPQQIGVSRDWVEARRASAARGTLLELHAVAPTPGLTTAKADHSLAASGAEVAAMAQALLAGSVKGDAWLARAAAALDGARGAGIVLAGAGQPAAVHAAVARINAAYGNQGTTVFYTAPVVEPAESLAALTEAMDRGEVQALVMLGVNPVYDAPADLDFAGRLSRVALKIHAGEYGDETAAMSDWHLPLTHPLESWGDARSFDGTVTLIQPTVSPLYNGLSGPEILSVLAGPEPRAGLDLLRGYWQGRMGTAGFEARWRETLLRGFIPDSTLPEERVQASAAPASVPVAVPPAVRPPAPHRHAGGGPAVVELVFRTDPTVYDGSHGNNSWLQELPKPLTKVVWENVILVSPRLAEQERLALGDVVTIAVAGRQIEGPVWILPGQAERSVTVTLGYGRRALDMLASGLGYDAYRLRSAASPWALQGAVLRRTGRTLPVATTQAHGTMEGHDFIRVQQVGAKPVGDNLAFTQPTLYDRTREQSDGRAWGMVIDLDSCIGCNACVVSCQAENNIAVVGREQAALGRDMHWLRVERYYTGGLDDPDTRFMPVPCMHCEDAPCEVGCPVEATLHDHEGLNLMVYNRCVGTRACSSYCPYKVRRFNYLDYSGGAAPALEQQRNPDVTVRSRGVMEKCTYCVQRIAEQRIVSDRDNKPIPDGAVQTACQTACPTRAISFGDLADAQSEVRAQRSDGRNYALLGELNTRPRTTYLAAMAPKDEG